MNSFNQVIEQSSSGVRLILRIPRMDALELLMKIRGLYGPSGSFLNVYHNRITYLSFSRDLPFLEEMLINSGLYEVKHEEGCIVLSVR